MSAAPVNRGTISLSNSIHLPLSDDSKFTKPVILPPGREKLETKPLPTGSDQSQRRCLLWVRSRHCEGKYQRPLYPQKQTKRTSQLLRLYVDLLLNNRDRKSTRLNSSHRCISYAV